MKIIAMMAFYDEPEELLKRSVRGMASLGVTDLIACDGSYSLYPGGLAFSPSHQVNSLDLLAQSRRIHLHLHQPVKVWAGNEVEKRQKMLDMAMLWANDGDWLAIWDCDYKFVSAPLPIEIVVRLRSTRCDVATVAFTEDPSSDDQGFYPMGMFIRAIPGIKMDGNHHTYVFPDGRRTQVLRRPVPNEAKALHMPDVKILHDVHARDPERRASQAAYYEARDKLQVES